MKYIPTSLYNIPECALPIMVSLIKGCCLQGRYIKQRVSSGEVGEVETVTFENFTNTIKSCLTIMEYLSYR